MNIYVASSWRNAQQPEVMLKVADYICTSLDEVVEVLK